MDLIYDPASRLLMKPVNILRDHSIEFSLRFHFREFIMRPVRSAVPCVHLLSVELKEHLRFMIQAAAAQKIFRLVSVKPHIVLIVESVFTPEIRNAALCRHARASEKGDML